MKTRQCGQIPAPLQSRLIPRLASFRFALLGSPNAAHRASSATKCARQQQHANLSTLPNRATKKGMQ